MMPAGADQVRKGPAGRVWIAPISFSSLSNVTVGSNPTPCRTVRNLNGQQDNTAQSRHKATTP